MTDKPHYFTSYFKRTMDNPRAVSISVSTPKGFKGTKFLELAPTWEMVNGSKAGSLKEEDYTRIYWDLIKDRGITADYITERYTDGTIFVCWEGPSFFCHRHLIASWLRAFGINIHELQ